MAAAALFSWTNSVLVKINDGDDYAAALEGAEHFKALADFLRAQATTQ